MTAKPTSENHSEVLTPNNLPFHRGGEHGKKNSQTLAVRLPIKIKEDFCSKVRASGKTSQAILEQYVIDYVVEILEQFIIDYNNGGEP